MLPVSVHGVALDRPQRPVLSAVNKVPITEDIGEEEAEAGENLYTV